MLDYNKLAEDLKSIAVELKAQIDLNADPDLSPLMNNKGLVCLNLIETNQMLAALENASRTINMLSIDSMQLDVQESYKEKVKEKFDSFLDTQLLLIKKFKAGEKDDRLAERAANELREFRRAM